MSGWRPLAQLPTQWWRPAAAAAAARGTQGEGDGKGAEKSPTERLAALLAEPLTYTLARALLAEPADVAVQICKEHGIEAPTAAQLEAGHWPVATVRELLEPALKLEVKALLAAGAQPDGAPRGADGRTPLMHCAMEGHGGAAKELLDAGAKVALKDVLGRTALHYAVISRSDVLVCQLLLARADPEEEDSGLHTPRSLAQQHGNEYIFELPQFAPPARNRDHLRSAARCAAAGLRCTPVLIAVGTPVHEIARQAAVVKAEAHSDVSLRSRERSRSPPRRGPSKPVVEASKMGPWRDPSMRLFEECVLLPRLPVLFRRHGDWPQRLGCGEGSPWSRGALLERAGDSQVDVSTIPYGDDFGCKDASVPVTLRRFLEVEIDLFAASGAAFYLFTAVDDRLQPSLAALLREELGLPKRLPAPFNQPNLQASMLQFAVGAKGSGSPPHFHDDAFNVLLGGRKRWRLWPPGLAAMSRRRWAELEKLPGAALDQAVEVEQEEGDVLYIPAGWGHSVLNEGDLNVCVAVEFSG